MVGILPYERTSKFDEMKLVSGDLYSENNVRHTSNADVRYQRKKYVNITEVCSWFYIIALVVAFVSGSVITRIYLTCLDNNSLVVRDNNTAVTYIYDGQHIVKRWPRPPSHEQDAKLARYVVHISEWCTLATISIHKDVKGYPFANVFSVSDGPFNKSTGIPYFYFTLLDISAKDLQVNSKASLTVSEAQSDYCAKNMIDPEDPRCCHVILIGTIIKLQNGSAEETFAKNSLFSRHWEMSTWPKGHVWYWAKLDISHIFVLDYFGGIKTVDVKDYFNADFTTVA